jgi:uncharacterized membrane protein required for colicin V production
MNWVDLALLLVVLLAVWGGWRSGFILGTLDLINWIGSVLLGFLFYPYLAKFLQMIFPALGSWLLPLALIATIILARLLIGVITSRISWAAGRAHDSQVNHFLGIFPGFISGAIWATVISALLLALPLWNGVTTQTRNSQIANRLSMGVEWVNEKFSPVFDKAVQQTINNLTIHPASNESVKLPFRSTRRPGGSNAGTGEPGTGATRTVSIKSRSRNDRSGESPFKRYVCKRIFCAFYAGG